MAKSKSLPAHIRALLAQFGRDKEAREAWIASNDALREALGYEWSFWRRPEQTAPLGNWRCWLILAGPGAGDMPQGGGATLLKHPQSESLENKSSARSSPTLLPPKVAPIRTRKPAPQSL